jgi:hypothetical protein
MSGVADVCLSNLVDVARRKGTVLALDDVRVLELDDVRGSTSAVI